MDELDQLLEKLSLKMVVEEGGELAKIIFINFLRMSPSDVVEICNGVPKEALVGFIGCLVFALQK